MKTIEERANNAWFDYEYSGAPTFERVFKDGYDYLEKLEKGEYAPIVKENLTVENPTCKDSLPVDREYWRRVYAGQAMAGQIAGVIARGAVKRTGKDTPHVITEAAVLFADALIEELEKTEKK